MQLYSYIVDLRIWHPKLDPELISQTLAMTPQIAHRVGDPRRTPIGTPLEGLHRESYWSANPFMYGWRESSEIRIEGALEELIRYLEAHTGFLASISEEGIVRIWVSSHSNENFAVELSPAILARLAKLGATFVHDVC